MTNPTPHGQAPQQEVQGPSHRETVDVVGVRSNGEHVNLEKIAMPPRMKAREIAIEQFGSFKEDDGSDAEMCFGALEYFLEWLIQQGWSKAPQPAPATQQAGDLARLLKEILADACHYESETNLRAELYQRLYDAHAALTATPQPTQPAQAAESVLEDAARWQWLADYLIGERTDLDEGIVACATIDALRQFADAARKQGANHD